jgi:hypothetical protein
MQRTWSATLTMAVGTAAVVACLSIPWNGLLAEGENSLLTVEIAIPAVQGKRDIPLKGEFHVVVTNTSGNPVKVMSQSCFEGRRQLSFEMTDETGFAWKVYRKEESVRRNVRGVVVLDPGEPMIIHVDFSSNLWESVVPFESLKGKNVKVRAIFSWNSSSGGVVSGLAPIAPLAPPGAEPKPASDPAPIPERSTPRSEWEEAWQGTVTSIATRTYLAE